MICIGFDTSNYTTSIAAFNGITGHNYSKLLPVKPGELGLRQSDALFSHIKQLPEVTKQLFKDYNAQDIVAVGVSTKPRNVEGSYMPCFLAGTSQAHVISSILNIPVFEYSHQQGHIAASCWSANRMELLSMPHLAWHLSGGTTELLLVEPNELNFHASRIGGTTDISAGQLIDRTGKYLDISFPAGREIDRLSTLSDNDDFFRVKVENCQFSFSGVQNKVMEYYEKTDNREATARYCILSIIYGVIKATKQAIKDYPDLPILFSGGVASNSMLQKCTPAKDCIFCPPQFSTDNAMGIAVLTWYQVMHNGTNNS